MPHSERLWGDAVIGTEVECAISNGREVCLCAAIRMPDGEVVCGHRHDNCYDVVRRRHRVKFGECSTSAKHEISRRAIAAARQGFLTSRGRFVDRREGMVLMKASGLPSHYREYFGDELFSEDLYPNGPIIS